MRTAEEILRMYTPVYHLAIIQIREIEKAINEARKEAIEECAEKAKSERIRFGANMGHAVDKQTILNLIKELE